jgi:hypothetical protein
MVKFEDELTVENGVVIARGPFDPDNEKIIELCAWVFQRDAHGDGNDVAATEMTEHHENTHHLLRNADDELKFEDKDDKGKHHWRLPIVGVGQGGLKTGKEAFAVAVAMIEEKGKQRVIWWGHPVMLKDGATA